MMLVFGVALGGVIGAPARYLIDGYVQDRTGGEFPWGTFAINISGAFVLGVITGLALHHGLGTVPRTILGTGVCGAFTTFSTFSYETVRLLEDGAWREGCLNVAASVVFGLLAAAAGLALVLLW